MKHTLWHLKYVTLQSATLLESRQALALGREMCCTSQTFGAWYL